MSHFFLILSTEFSSDWLPDIETLTASFVTNTNEQRVQQEIWPAIPSEPFAERDVWCVSSTLPSTECVEPQIGPLIANENAVVQGSYSSMPKEQCAEREVWPPISNKPFAENVWSTLPNAVCVEQQI